ncbi:MAG: hypothetical protein JWM91_5012 [Rhodospirillales bacterium]|nr:hypothetical protein [Rhodospirillales bacterium]
MSKPTWIFVKGRLDLYVDLTPHQENQVIQIAAQAGRDVGEVAGEMFSRFPSEEVRFIAAVQLGEAELGRGNSLTHSGVARGSGVFVELDGDTVG